MKLSHSANLENKDEIHMDDLDPEDLQPFPTLQRCFETVDHDTGFNIELKYPQEMEDGSHEQDPYFDLNEFLDIILKVVFEHHNGRRIIFSSFSPAICIGLRQKQNRYPVLFLTQGNTKLFDPYKDIRTKSVVMATEFALAHSLLGIDVGADLLVEDMTLIKYVKDTGLVLFVWGEDNNDSNMINTFKQKGVDGIIYDRIDHYKTGKESVFKIERSQKVNLLRKFGGENEPISAEMIESESSSESDGQ